MARKKSVAAYREQMADSMARVETNVEELLRRADEDRRALAAHTAEDARQFEKLDRHASRTDKIIYCGIGGMAVIEFLLRVVF